MSIIDISSTGDQPLYNEDRTKVLVFNGEIYNYQELREKLIEAGHEFKTHTDSETLLHGYEEWGEALVDRLRGMYGFVIWDREKKKMFGARDIFGIKPFYYAQMNGSFYLVPRSNRLWNTRNSIKYLMRRHWEIIYHSSLCLQMRPFLKGYIVSSRDIILLTRMESLRLQDTLNRILQEIRTSHLMRLWMKSRK